MAQTHIKPYINLKILLAFVLLTTISCKVFAADDQPTHFIISHPSESIYCLPLQVTIIAASDNKTASNYADAIIIKSGNNKGNWSIVSGAGVFLNEKTNDGEAQYTFSADDKGIAIFNLQYEGVPPTINIKAYSKEKPNINSDAFSKHVDFSNIGFILTAEEFFSSNKAYNKTQTAGIEDTIHITAYGTTESYKGKDKNSSKSCGIIKSYDGDKNVEFWQEYVDPSTGTLLLTINGNSIAKSEPSSSTQKVTFNDGKAQVSINYRDVGRIKVFIRDNNNNLLHSSNNDDNDDDDDDDTTIIKSIRGSTDEFVVKPAKFMVDITDNPEATNEQGPIFKKAGESFTLKVTAQDNDGNTTPNYGNEKIPAGVQVYSSSLVSPINGYNGSKNDGAIANNDSFTKINPGIFQGQTFSYDEVGIIKITAESSDKDYLNAGNVSGPESANVGRFIPSHFTATANTPSFYTACSAGGFSYIGQNITYSTKPIITIYAVSTDNTTTKNYTGNYFKLTKPSITTSYLSNSSLTFDSSAAEIDITLLDNNNGTANVILGDGGGIKYNKINSIHSAPFDAEIAISNTFTDSDNVKYVSSQFLIGNTTNNNGINFSSGNTFYQGRMALMNNYGSELISLTIPIKTEYFNGSIYAINTADSCTVFSNPFNLIISGTPSSMKTNATITNVSNGIGKITLTSPTPTGSTGHFNIKADLPAENLEYLQHDWPHDNNSDGIFNDNPQAQGTFGIYEGQTSIIYIREVTD